MSRKRQQSKHSRINTKAKQFLFQGVSVEAKKPKSRRELLIGQYGMFVSRSVLRIGLEHMYDTVDEKPVPHIKFRNLYGDRDFHATVLRPADVHCLQNLIGSLTVKRSIAAINDSVLSLSDRIDVEPDSVNVFGKDADGNRSVGITFSSENAKLLRVEHDDIVRTLLAEACDPVPADIQWRPYTPHVTIGKVAASLPKSDLHKSLHALENILPEKLTLLNANTVAHAPVNIAINH